MSSIDDRLARLFEYFEDKERSARGAADVYMANRVKLLAEADAYQDAVEMVAEAILTTEQKLAAAKQER